jgi:pSer/pThr/pTyr-binding forkhead associated (FHA) protein
MSPPLRPSSALPRAWERSISGLLVNTGTAVVLKDLHSKSGTRCRDTWVDLVTLSDGDVLRLGETVFQVAIQTGEQDPSESVSGLVYADPLMLPEPIDLRRLDTSESWRAEEVVTVIGRSPGAAIRLDHPEVSLVHAAIIGVGSQLAVVDLDSRTGLMVNGQACAFSPLSAGDRLRIGPFEIGLGKPAGAAAETKAAPVKTELPVGAASLAPNVALESLREELGHRACELEQKAARLERDQRAIEAARLSLEKERSALLRQAGALREMETALEARRRSLEQREKALRESLLRQAHGALGGTTPAAAASAPDCKLAATAGV